MSLRLGGKRGYWIALGAGALVVLLMLFLWVIPAHSAAVQAQNDWEVRVKQLDVLRTAVNAKKIPSMTALESIREYRDWLKKQDKDVRAFFTDRANLLEASITGQGEPNPVDFKEKYKQAVKTQIEGLQGRLNFSDTKNIFPAYNWMGGVGIPRPEDFTSVLRGYWTRVILYNNIFLNPSVQVRLVKKLDLGNLVPLTPDGDVAGAGQPVGPFDAVPFSMDVTLAPENVTKLIEKLLAVSTGISNTPVINLTRMSLTPEPPLCGLQLDGNILLIRRDPAENRPEPAKKVEAPKP